MSRVLSFSMSLILLVGVSSACGQILDDGTYAFSSREEAVRTCEELELPPARWEGGLKSYGTEVQIAFPAIHAAVGERTLVGRFFVPGEHEREFVADVSFHLELPLEGEDCPAFAQIGLEGITDGDRAFHGTLQGVYAIGPTAPAACPRACFWSVAFRAERIGSTMEESARSPP